MGEYMCLAIEEAKVALKRGVVPVGAVVVSDGEVIGAAHNEAASDGSAESFCVEGAQAQEEASLRLRIPLALQHAEFVAVSRTRRKRLDDCEIYTTLEPCLMCFSAIALMRIKRIVFGAYDVLQGAVSKGAGTFFCRAPEVFGGICEQECASLLSSFFKSKRG
jgi:tRNA(adenine34) deaminase